MPTANGTSHAAPGAWAAIQPSDVARRTFNPIRDVLGRPVEPLSTPRSSKDPISLSIGDPTVFGNFKAHPAVVEAVQEAVRSYSFNGYPPSACRRRVTQWPESTPTPAPRCQLR
ncbi:hypothetical protein IWQ57_002190 [Coemansia nantahalensis]|uniref:Uncharacterized protein n=1 Tax=Coemansia nantahalensis TaxID=2789366 RepID=A0ACC1K166_9FUNG|nr:hypothetical protein IWQ57_002190 [Coemansia nantahalensis]